MAIDNLNYYSAGLPAGQQTDRYSSQPGCLRSKNLDIFSSSKSVKATAFSQPVALESGVIASEGGLELRTDGKVYNSEGALVVDPSQNFPVYQISYNGKNGDYADATRGQAQSMSVVTEGDEWKSFVVFTDRASYVYSKVKKTLSKTLSETSGVFSMNSTAQSEGYEFTSSGNLDGNGWFKVVVNNPGFASIPLRIYAIEPSTTECTISVTSIQVRDNGHKYYYDAASDSIMPTDSSAQSVSFVGTLTSGIYVEVPVSPSSTNCVIWIAYYTNRRAGASGSTWNGGKFYIDVNGGPDSTHYMKIGGQTSEGDFNSYYNYLPIRERELTEIGVYGYSMAYWMKGATYQYIYQWQSSFAEVGGEIKTRYDFVTDMGWANAPGMDVIGMIVWNEQVYMIGNMDGDGYIIPCDLAGGVGTPYIAYGCTFKGVTNIDYLLYLVGENRGISCLWVYNGQELVPVIGGREEKDSKNLIKNEEQYKFDGKIVNWRKNLILTTEDNRIFQYGQTFGGKGGVFIHELPSEATITGLKANGNDLEINYSITESGTTTNYSITYQDDTPIKNYNTEWMAEYPIVLGNHLLEKEESDLFVSYILPSADCSLEFWGMANHYHFRTFTSEDDYTFDSELSYKLKGATGDYELKYIETNGNQYTFRLEGDLPIQTTNDMKITDTEGVELINYSEYNHFRKIGEITTTEYQEGEFRFHNLNNKLELPKSHSLQIMVKGKGNQNYTPELFALDLVANQRERG